MRRVPPLGVTVPELERLRLEARLSELHRELSNVKNPLVPDVEVLLTAVESNLRYQELQSPAEIQHCHSLLKLAEERLRQLQEENPAWLRQTGLVVRGFASRLDGSVQPYALLVPEEYDFQGEQRHRLDFWFHGRGEKTNEIAFIQQSLTKAPAIHPPGAFVLLPYARYSNGNKFAGEIDCLEALEHAQAHYRIDEDRIVVRGFSMGGAAAWNFAVHYTDRWAAANPGAGFAETQEFLRIFQNETVDPPWYQRKLWHLYDCTDYALNLFHLPVVAYSGELDRQKQAADIMARAMAREQMTLEHIIGPQTAHKIHPDSMAQIEARLEQIVRKGRDRMPRHIRFTTWTLRYPRMHWVSLDRLDHHWEPARFEAKLEGASRIAVCRTDNIRAFTLDMPGGISPLDPACQPVIAIAGQELKGVMPSHGGAWKAHLVRSGSTWVLTSRAGGEPSGLAKKPGLQGPIDDAFLDSFLFVEPTGRPGGDEIGAFVEREQRHAVEQWRQQFRGRVRMKKDVEVTPEDLQQHHLVLWGDYSSNRLLSRILPQLPIVWNGEVIRAGDRVFDSRRHALLLIYPNPLSPERYVVLNSSFTFREYDYLNNARQVPKLPDWAVVDVTSPGTSQAPGKVVEAGFFGEHWELLPRVTE